MSSGKQTAVSQSADVDDLIASFAPATKETLSIAEGTSLAQLLPQVYEELRRMADGYLCKERPGHTLQPTALVHEAYLRLLAQRTGNHWQSRSHLLAISARMMRRILVNHALARKTQKRGCAAPHVSLDDALLVFDREQVSALEVNRVLMELETLNQRQAQIAELRFFGGLSIEETGEALAISAATVKREWSVARLWLERELRAPA